ncbi:MAG: ATP-binding cassette domain-containing protein [Bacteroidales bacterium]|nr:ATP-binding cassette domain-containing protein [Bacteroidales bacterium]
MSVAIEHISMRIGRQHVLDDVTLHIGDGEVLGLLGPNGAGKSTLMKILVGLRQPTSGSVRVPGKAEIGYLPEQNPLYNDMFVREYLLFMARLGRVDSTRVELVIRETGLTPEVHKRVGQLSKGYRQRVGLAQALLQNPKLLILDEPTTGLDPNQLDEIRPLIRRLGQDRTVILSTHILQEVQKMCTRVVILDHGVIKADTTDLSAVEDLFRDSTSDPRPLTPDL